jgi:hypothetical protein
VACGEIFRGHLILGTEIIGGLSIFEQLEDSPKTVTPGKRSLILERLMEKQSEPWFPAPAPLPVAGSCTAEIDDLPGLRLLPG